MLETATFVCSICGESSTDICVYCTKDTCANHRCVRCGRCSDCCECEVPMTASEPEEARLSPPPPATEAAVPPPPPGQAVPSQAEPAGQPEPRPVPEVPFVPANMPEPEPAQAAEPEQAPEPPPQPDAASEEPAPSPVIAAIEQATTHEELVAALPELFAPEPAPPATPAPPEASEEPDLNTPRPEVVEKTSRDDEEEEPGTAPNSE